MNNREYTFKKSNSSFKLSEVTSFTFGPVVSRFWMLRKHTITMDQADLMHDAPFYGWNCITLSIAHKWDIYLIIKNEAAMTKFIKLLIYKTDTLDGLRGSARRFKQARLNELKKALKLNTNNS